MDMQRNTHGYAVKSTKTVGVLGMGVPQSTCWKAQLRPIYINTARSSSTRLSPKTLAEGCPARRYQTRPARDRHKPSRSSRAPSRTAAPASSPRNQLQARGRRGLLLPKWLSTTRRAPRVKEQPPPRSPPPYFPPASIPRHLYGGTIVFLFYSSGQVVFLLSTPVATPPSPLS